MFTHTYLIYIVFFALVFMSQGCRYADKSKADTISKEDSIDIEPPTELVGVPQPPTLAPEDELLGLGEVWTGDLDSMITRRRIRALVPYNHTYYFIDGTERRGLAFEALNLFEAELNKELGTTAGVPKVRVVFIPTSHDQLIPLLRAGYGDLAFSGLTVTPEREEVIDFSIPTITGMNEVVVSGPASPTIKGLRDLAGQPVYVHATSSYRQSLRLLSDSLVKAGHEAVRIEILAEYLETEDALQMVHAGVIPFTIVEDNLAQHWAKVLDGLTVHDSLVVRANTAYACAIRENSPQLKEVINRFISENRKGTKMGNILYNRYLKNSKYIQNAMNPSAMERFRKTEALFQKYGNKYNLDWLLLAAQGFQESRLQQEAVSSTGAVGIMQIKPTTAAGNPISIEGVDKVENNIHAGAKYLRFLMDRYFTKDSIDELNQRLFAIAAYNAGPARINRLRKQAKDQGLNPNQWFDQVEMVVAKEIGRETVQYVSNIYKYYTSYRSLLQYGKLKQKFSVSSHHFQQDKQWLTGDPSEELY